jgi:hypothetical protein
VVKLCLLLATVVVATACADETVAPPDAQPPAAEATSQTVAEAAQEAAFEEEAPPSLSLEAGQEISIPAGTLLAGSPPGSEDRNPQREADLVPVPLPAFRIDRLPYPNDPAHEPLTGVSREDAAALCEEEGKRLCTELEWERACKGERDRAYPTGATLDRELCASDSLACSSPFGVLTMGTAGYEWTSSPVTTGLGSTRYSAVVRGAAVDDPIAEGRCAARHALDPTEPEAGFRCCRGGSNEAQLYPAEERRHPFVDREVPQDELRRILASMPELARFAPRFTLFDAEAVDDALARGDETRDTIPWTIVSGVVVWSPEHGEEAWVFAGSDGESTVLAVIHPMPDGTFVHGSSFVIVGEEAPPIALAWDYGLRRQILWGTAWGETGESGVVEHRDDHRIVIVQR